MPHEWMTLEEERRTYRYPKEAGCPPVQVTALLLKCIRCGTLRGDRTHCVPVHVCSWEVHQEIRRKENMNVPEQRFLSSIERAEYTYCTICQSTTTEAVPWSEECPAP